MKYFEKQPNEKFIIQVKFDSSLDDDEVISSYTVTAYLLDVDVTSMVIDAHTGDADNIRIRVKSGTTGNKYKITTLITTNLGNAYEKDVLMKVCEI